MQNYSYLHIIHLASDIIYDYFDTKETLCPKIVDKNH